MKTTLELMVLIMTSMLAVVANGIGRVTVVEAPETKTTNSFYIANRPPLAPSPLVKLPIGAIKPAGWLRHQLELERDGMTGRLKEVSPWLDFAKSSWRPTRKAEAISVGRRCLWLKGYVDQGYVLEDDTVIVEAKRWIEAVLASQRAEGWFGPRELLTSLEGKPDLWPHMVW